MKCNLLVTALIGFLGVMLAQAPAHAIYKGNPVNGNRLFWQSTVKIAMRGNVGWCSGNIISDRFVLTAGHCIPNHPTSIQFMKDSVSPVTTRPVVQAMLHPKYDRQHDIAILEFSGGLPASYKAITMADHFNSTPEKIYIAGYGKTAPANRGGRLYYAAGKTYPIDQPNLTGFDGLTQQFPCPGDSGGPMMVQRDGRWQLLGVASIGYGRCDSRGRGGMYTIVPDFLPWINAVMAGGT